MFHLPSPSRFSATILALGSFLLAQPTLARQITVKNSCGLTVYPAYAGQGGTPTLSDGSPAPAGWELAANAQTVLDVPEGWHDARIWLRSGGCDGSVGSCQIGFCKSKSMACDGTEFGSVGATVAEFNINNQDFYDVSMVEGFTVAMTITPSDSSCTVGSCGVDQDPLKNCDARLVWPKGSQEIMGCANPCTAGVQFTALGGSTFDYLSSPSCCLGQYTGAKCTPEVIPFYDALKSMCKMGYVYAKDDLPVNGHDQTAVFACNSKPDFTLELCPGGVNTGLKTPPAIAQAVAMDPGSGGQLNVGGSGGSGSSVGGGSESTSVGKPQTSESVVSPPPKTSEPPITSIYTSSDTMSDPTTTSTPPVTSIYTSSDTIPDSITTSTPPVITSSTKPNEPIRTGWEGGWGEHSWGGGVRLEIEPSSAEPSITEVDDSVIMVTETLTETAVVTCQVQDKRKRGALRDIDMYWNKRGAVYCP